MPDAETAVVAPAHLHALPRRRQHIGGDGAATVAAAICDGNNDDNDDDDDGDKIWNRENLPNGHRLLIFIDSDIRGSLGAI